MIVLVAVVSAALSGLVIPAIADMSRSVGLTRTNYRGKTVPSGLGLSFWLVGLAGILLGMALGAYPADPAWPYLFGVSAMALAGAVDDCLGGRGPRGLAGHLGQLGRGGDLTTGGFKALVGMAVGLGVGSALQEGLWRVALAALLVALSTNGLNLMDRRPGRALKVYLAAFAVLATFAPGGGWTLMLPLAVVALVFLPWDLKEVAMMGDAGSNQLGASLGIVLALGAGVAWQVLLVVALAGLHLYAEARSVSEAVERSGVLRFLDGLGRKRV